MTVAKGFFGSSVNLEKADFNMYPNYSYDTGPIKIAPAGGWYSINLIGEKEGINTMNDSGGVTQIRLSFTLDDNNDTVANYLSIYSGNAPIASRPQLVIEYYVP